MTSPVTHVAPRPRGRPLEGRRIVLTRPRAQAGDFEIQVRTLGGEPVVAPAIAVVPPDTWTIPDAALRRVGTYDWIVFTSANAVRALLERAGVIGVDHDELRDRRIAVVGPATASVVSNTLRLPDFAPTVHTGEALGQELPDVENGRILLPRGDLAGDAPPDVLRARGAFVDEIVVYRTVPGPGIAEIANGVRAGAVDALLFASASAVRFVADAMTATPGAWPVAACLGPITADEAREAGFRNVIVAQGTTQDELIDVVVRWFSRPESQGD